jgi:hypothetical protein
MGGGSKRITVGFRYYMGLHFGVCYGPVDNISRIFVGEREAWSGDQDESGTISIDNDQLFGGQKREGGVVGDLDVMMGGGDQTQNAYLQTLLGSNIPAFRGILSLVLKKGYISANNPYIKPWAFRLRRTVSGWNTTVWQPSLCNIAMDMNPAHIIYQCLTDPVWGMGYPESGIGSTFIAAAETMNDELFGLSLLWNQQAPIGEFIGQVLNHIGGVLYADPKTGRFELKLIRDDYDPEDLPVFNQSNVKAIDSFQRAGFGETINEVTIVFRDKNTNKDVGVTVHDLANIQAQGGVVSVTKQYPGISNHALAARVAQRDLLAASTPLAKLSMRVNRQAWSLIPGDVFKLTWTSYGLIEVIFRCLAVNYGTLEDGTMTIEAAEDVFGLPDSSYIAQEPEGWVEPDTSPNPITTYDLIELPYYHLATQLSQADFAYVEENSCFMASVAAVPPGTAMTYKLWRSFDLVEVADGAFCPRATLHNDIDKQATSIFLDNESLTTLASNGSWAIIGTGRDAEVVGITSVVSAGSLIISRGILDTTPKTWPAGTPIWLASEFLAADETEYATGETAGYKFSTIATGGETDPSDSPTASRTCDQRQHRPYPPANLRINGAYYPLNRPHGNLTISWAHRDRTVQTAELIPQDEDSIGPEPGVSYTLRFYSGVTFTTLEREVTGLTADSYIYTNVDQNTDGGPFAALKVSIFAVRDGLESWHTNEHTFTFTV